jgi:hypothetical protein
MVCQSRSFLVLPCLKHQWSHWKNRQLLLIRLTTDKLGAYFLKRQQLQWRTERIWVFDPILGVKKVEDPKWEDKTFWTTSKWPSTHIRKLGFTWKMFFWDPTFPKLVGGIPTPAEKYELVSWDDYSQYMEKQKKTNHQPENHLGNYRPTLDYPTGHHVMLSWAIIHIPIDLMWVFHIYVYWTVTFSFPHRLGVQLGLLS